jgi:hypothetical protein
LGIEGLTEKPLHPSRRPSFDPASRSHPPTLLSG